MPNVSEDARCEVRKRGMLSQDLASNFLSLRKKIATRCTAPVRRNDEQSEVGAGPEARPRDQGFEFSTE